jgi:molybdopterin adenylyltransferase
MLGLDLDRPFTPLRVAVLTLTDTRSEAEDRSGAYLVGALTEAGHTLACKQILHDRG